MSQTDIPANKADTREIVVNLTELKKLDARPKLQVYVRKVWERRHFIVAQGQTKALSGGRGTYLGALWLFLNPIFQVAIYAVVFGLIMGARRGIDNFIGFLVLGVVFFGFLSNGLSAGSGLMQQNKALISAFTFPRAALPISTTVKALIDDLIPAVLAVVVALLFQVHQSPSWTILLVVPLYILIHLFSLGLTFFVARATAFIPDLKNLVAVINRALFFLSGVFFSIDRFETHPLLKEVVLANPFYQFLTSIRTCVLDGAVPSHEVWLYLATWSLTLFFTGFIYFWHAEERYGTVR